MNNFLSNEGRSKLQIMSNMIRFNNAIHIHNENVAEHSFYVAIYSMVICDAIGICGLLKQLCIEKALIHDVHEIEISDIPHNVKSMIPGMIETCNEIEEEYNKEKFEIYSLEYQILSEKNRKKCDCIVNIADILSVVQYSIQEIEIGNKKRFVDVYKSACSRLNEELKNLKNLIEPNEFKKLIDEMEISYA